MRAKTKPGIDLDHARTPTPRVDIGWQSASDEERMAKVRRITDQSIWEVVSAKANGTVIVKPLAEMDARRRGLLLLEIERRLQALQPGIEVYLQAQVDKNVLRKLRGVQIVEA